MRRAVVAKRMQNAQNARLGLVHMYKGISENVAFSMRFGFSFKDELRFRLLKTDI